MTILGFLKKDYDYLSVSFSDESLKMAYLRAHASFCEVINVLRRDIRGISEDELPRIIKSALSDLDIKKPKGICVVSSNLTTTKNIEIPSLNPEEIKSIINLQAGRHTPYSREEIIIDYINIGAFQRNYSKVLLVIVNRNVIKKQLSILEQGGLKIQSVPFASESIARFYSKALNLTAASAPIGIIDIGHHFTDFTIGSKGTTIACRNIPIGMTHLTTEGEGAKERLIAELKKSIESYQNDDIEKLPESYLLTSDNRKIKDLQFVLREALKSNVKIVPYLDHLRTGPIARKVIADSSDESFLDIIAPVVTLRESQIDLLPEEVKLQRSIESQGREIIKAGVFVIIIIVFFCAWFFTKIYFKSSFLSKLKTDHEPNREEAQILEGVSEKTGMVKDHLSDRLTTLDAIDELYRIIPEEIYLNSVILEENGKITIQGISESMSRVFSLVGGLEESPLFKNVKTNSTNARKERGKDVAAFELTFRLEGTKDDTEQPKEGKETKETRETKEPTKKSKE